MILPPIIQFKNKSFVYPKHFYCEFAVHKTPMTIESVSFVENRYGFILNELIIIIRRRTLSLSMVNVKFHAYICKKWYKMKTAFEAANNDIHESTK